MIDKFDGENFFLSNFYGCEVTYDGITYKNSEAAFQAQKVANPNKRGAFANLSPSEAKKLGRKVELRSDWESVKDKYMYAICYAKFSQNPHLKEKLLETGGEFLEEGNYWHDNYWGICSCDKCKEKLGQNKLGQILMTLRLEFQRERRKENDKV